MAFSYSQIQQDFVGALKRKVYSVNFASVTTGTIVTGMNIKYTEFINKTGARAGQSIDDTTTAGSVVIASVTANDVGYVVVYGT